MQRLTNQRLTNQRAKLTVEFTAKLFWVISIIASVMHTKNRIGFATDCKSDPVFQFETEFFLSPFFDKSTLFSKACGNCPNIGVFL